jgi:broad specificity phosphatase PhoE
MAAFGEGWGGSMALFFVVRHGQTDWNRTRRLQGHKDVPLNSVGKAQAKDLAEEVARELGGLAPPVFTSDLRRASETALTLAKPLGSSVKTARFLRERGFGTGEGKTWSQLEQEMPQVVADYKSRRDRDAIPGSEPMDDFRTRVLRGFRKLSKRVDGSAIVVTHGGVIHVLLEEALGRGKKFIISNGAMYRFEVDRKTIRRVVSDRTASEH